MRTTTRPRHRITLIVAITVSLLAALPGVAGAAAGFGDVDEGEYYTEAVRWMVDEQITEGIEVGCFGPDLDVTRGQVATFLFRLDDSLGNDPVAASHPFIDVVASYQQAPVDWLYGAGLTTGVTPTTFAPNEPITRGDFAVLLWRYADEPTATADLPFTDVTKGYQRAAIAWMAGEAITTGTTPTTFDPDGLVSRAQAAAFLFRFVAPTEIAPAVASVDCTLELRIALEAAGFTGAEARCAVPYLVDFEIEYLVGVVEERLDPNFELLIAASRVANECLSPDRIADFTRLFF
ncbi:MAG: S-layer homology domain-containing protein [Actinomycetota bacterium]